VSHGVRSRDDPHRAAVCRTYDQHSECTRPEHPRRIEERRVMGDSREPSADDRKEGIDTHLACLAVHPPTDRLGPTPDRSLLVFPGGIEALTDDLRECPGLCPQRLTSQEYCSLGDAPACGPPGAGA
jgi:hypothetical protein